MKEIGAIFVVSISEIRTVQLTAIKRRYSVYKAITAIRMNEDFHRNLSKT